MPNELTVTVRFFAAAKQQAGRANLVVTLAAPATVRTLVTAVLQQVPALGPLMPKLRVAVDEEFAADDTALQHGAEVALIPPVAGGAPEPRPLLRVVDAPLVLEDAVIAVATPGHGGLVTFSGQVRDSTAGRRVTRLEYEAYVPMAEKKLQQIAQEVQQSAPGARVAVVHRVGTLLPGELAVVIAVSTPHRREAFEGCQHVIERLKQDVPIWKREVFEDGAVWVGLGP